MTAADRSSGRAIRLLVPGLPFLDFFFDLDQWSKYAGMVIVRGVFKGFIESDGSLFPLGNLKRLLL